MDFNLTIDDANREGLHGLRDRCTLRRAGPDIEQSLMQRALDAAVLHIPFGESGMTMRAQIVKREHFFAEPENRYRFIARDRSKRLTLAQLIELRDRLPSFDQIIHLYSPALKSV
jgi:hypothetical protein